MPVATDAFAALPDPAGATSPDDLTERLRRLKVWAGDPSYETIKERVNAAWTAAGRPPSELARRSTVANCFQAGRRRFNTDLLVAVVEALHPDPGYVTQWRQALRVVGGETEAVAQVRVQDTLPDDLGAFTGRAGELDRIRRAARDGGAVVISAIEGMAGVGKTRLAVHAGHLLLRERVVERVLFVNLRGFHPDRSQPPADPAAVLDGFLRLLGAPGQEIPHGPAARAAAYRDRLAGTRTLVVLDNAATAEQVRPLLPETAGCPTLVTSRRDLGELGPAARLTVEAFTPDEARAYLAATVPAVPAGPDPGAAARIAGRCGNLPLALSLIAGHIRGTPGWTLTDHADRLDERHRDRRLDSGVELALALSYAALPADRQRFLRLAALHPGQDLDAYAAAALAGTGLAPARAALDDLCRDHLLQRAAGDRYTFHDLVRAYAAGRAHDEDPPGARRAALTRLFDHYLAAAGAAMDRLHPAEAHRRPPVPPAPGPAPEPGIAWLDTERPTLVAVAAHTAAHGWPGHTVRLARVLYRYLQGGHNTDALAVHGHALRAARDSGDLAGQGHALTGLGVAHLRMGGTEPGTDCLRQSLDRFRQADDPAGQAFALYNLGMVAERSGRLDAAIDQWRRALALYRRAGDPTGEALTRNGLGIAMEQAGRYAEAIEHSRAALELARRAGNRYSEAFVLNSLGVAETKAGEPGAAAGHLGQALTLFRELSNRTGEAIVLDSLGLLHTRTGRPDEAADCHEQALTILRELGDRDGQTHVLNGLGQAALAAGRPAEALAHHTEAEAIAAAIGSRGQQGVARAGQGHAHRALGNAEAAREHFALALSLGVPEADRIRALLADPNLAGYDPTGSERAS